MGSYTPAVEKRIELGVEVEDDRDREVLLPGTWVLQWQRTANGAPDRRMKMWWVQLGPIIEKAFRYKNGDSGARRWRPVALGAEISAPEPFDATEKRFALAFREVILRPAFEDLLTLDYEGAWFTPARLELMKKLWIDVKAAYATSSRAGG